MMPWIKRESGQASVEAALVFTFILAPVTFGFLTLTFGVLTWAGVVHLTRIGAVYASTHCATDGAGSNVVGYMQSNIPPMLDPTQLITGPATISVTYLT